MGRQDGLYKRSALGKRQTRTVDLLGTNCAGVVSRDSVWIAFMYAALNGFDIHATDIQNAYIQIPTSEKHHVICGPELCEHIGKKALIRRALYGGKSAGRNYWLHLRSCIEFPEYNLCKTDPDIWMGKAKCVDNTDYWEYVLLYLDDRICISTIPEKFFVKRLVNTF